MGAIVAGIVILLAGQAEATVREAAVLLDASREPGTRSEAMRTVPFTGLAAAFSPFAPGTTLKWADEHDMYLSSWVLNRDREFRRVEQIALRHGATLTRP